MINLAMTGRQVMRALLIYACFVVVSNILGVFVGSFVQRYTSPEIGTILILGWFFGSLIVSWIATVFVMDGSLNNFFAEQEQLEAEKKGREYVKRSGGA
jgi:hypothetical protein